MGQTVNLLVYTFGGSNPSSPTKSKRIRKGILRKLKPRNRGFLNYESFGLLTRALSGDNAEVAQLIEHQPSKLRVASLSLVFRSKIAVKSSNFEILAYVAQG